jgi:hypothetical protein
MRSEECLDLYTMHTHDMLDHIAEFIAQIRRTFGN